MLVNYSYHYVTTVGLLYELSMRAATEVNSSPQHLGEFIGRTYVHSSEERSCASVPTCKGDQFSWQYPLFTLFRPGSVHIYDDTMPI